ncbi:MAG: MGMT family protein [Chloroflexi bacterium]|nr:MGMT family protein [Chloroflexota bacterium]
MQGFAQRVFKLIAQVPEGQVVTYGSIARALGEPQGARMVGWAMHQCPEGLPWYRVLNSQGRVSLPGEGGALQRSLLEDEGVEFDERDRVDLARYLWDAEAEYAE